MTMRQSFSGPVVLRCLSLLAVAVLLAACASDAPVSRPGSGSATPGYKIGAPYQIEGTWYSPGENYSYDESGVASWYGPGFHLKKTANGEIFDAGELTAAHRTLPMPTLARVTNLDNGRSVIVRINDRGPFARGRIIDVSRKAASLLDFVGKGTARVRVQVLADESRAIAQAAKAYGTVRTAQDNRNLTYSTASVTPVQPAMATNDYMPPEPPMPQRIRHDSAETGIDLPQMTQLTVKPHTRIYVQAGSFTMAGNAEMLKRKVAEYGPTNVDVAAVNGITFYRVRIGPIADVAQADTMLSRVSQAGVANPRIIVD